MRSGVALTEIAEDVGQRFRIPLPMRSGATATASRRPDCGIASRSTRLRPRHPAGRDRHGVVRHVGHESDQLDRCAGTASCWATTTRGEGNPPLGARPRHLARRRREAADHARKRKVPLSGFSQGFTGALIDELRELIRLRNVAVHTLRVSRDPTPQSTIRRLDELGAVRFSPACSLSGSCPHRAGVGADVLTERGLHGFDADVNRSDRVGAQQQPRPRGSLHERGRPAPG